jgi:hypothetical protein
VDAKRHMHRQSGLNGVVRTCEICVHIRMVPVVKLLHADNLYICVHARVHAYDSHQARSQATLSTLKGHQERQLAWLQTAAIAQQVC